MSFNPLSSLSYTTSAVSSGLSGTIPPEISYLQDLITLDLNDNDIGGVIPNAFGDLLQLETIFLHDNDIVGSVPSQVCWLRESGMLNSFIADCDTNPPEVRCDCCDNCGGGGTSSSPKTLPGIQFPEGKPELDDLSFQNEYQEETEEDISEEDDDLPFQNEAVLEEFKEYQEETEEDISEEDEPSFIVNVRPTPAPFVIDTSSREAGIKSILTGTFMTVAAPSRQKAMDWIINTDSQRLEAADKRLIQRYVFALMYFSMGGDSWAFENWLEGSKNECQWVGVACDGNGLVSGIALRKFTVCLYSSITVASSSHYFLTNALHTDTPIL